MTGPRGEPGGHPGMALLRAIAAAAPAGSALELVDMTSTAWASATFTGARHVLRLRARDDEAVAGWLADLPEAQFRLREHLVADLAVTAVERRDGAAAITIESLTLEEARRLVP